MEMVKVYIVQSLNTFEFLCPYEGDVGFTPYLNCAGHFLEMEQARETALEEIGENFAIFGCYLYEHSLLTN